VQNSAQESLKEYAVQTECGRNFVWSAHDLDHCLRSIVYAGYRATHIEEYHEEVRKPEAQEELNHEVTKSIEESAA
jgi:hypothetical protein